MNSGFPKIQTTKPRHVRGSFKMPVFISSQIFSMPGVVSGVGVVGMGGGTGVVGTGGRVGIVGVEGGVGAVGTGGGVGS